MDQWTQIRNIYFNQRQSIRQIARTLGIHRSAVKRALTRRGGPRYERQVPYHSILDPFKAEIRQMIEEAEGDILATVIYERLSCREETETTPRYHGTYQTLCRYVREVKANRKPKEAFLRIEPPAGFDAQCDWGKVELMIGDEQKRLSMFVLKLSYSRYRFARLFYLERQECFFSGHVEAFAFFGGIPKQVTYDNLTTAVAKILKGRNRTEQEAFTRFRGEFPFSSNFAAPRKGNEKGKVENDIKYIRNHAFALKAAFDTLDEANAHLLSWLNQDNNRIHGTHKEVIRERFLKEKPHLSPLPVEMPLCCRVVGAKVNKFSFVQFETNRYSVPTAYVYHTVILKVFEGRLVIVTGDTVIASHPRLLTRGQEIVNPYHFLSLLEQKARAVDHAVVMQAFELDPIRFQLKEALAHACENPNREWIRILRLTETYPMQQVVDTVHNEPDERPTGEFRGLPKSHATVGSLLGRLRDSSSRFPWAGNRPSDDPKYREYFRQHGSFGRGFGKELHQFYRYARGSARESKGWYLRAKFLLPADIVAERTALLDEVIGILVTTLEKRRQRKSN